MSNIALDEHIREDVREYFQAVQLTQSQQQELDDFLTQISPSLKNQVNAAIFSTILNQENETIKATMRKLIQSKGAQATDTNNGMIPTIGAVHKKNGPSRSKALLKGIVYKLGTALYSPEAFVMTQDDEYDEKTVKIYYLGKGKCFVNVRDEIGHEHEGVKVLEEGHHFGEVAMIYKCKRTASVICRNYNTLAFLVYKAYRELVAEYPEYEECLKDYIRNNYHDPKTTFLLNMVQRVDYLAGVSKEILFDIIFSLVPKSLEKE
jgi:hypothetical protein